MSSSTADLEVAIKALTEGGIIAYPTESVYGLGCDALNTTAINRLLALKSRAANKGFIVVAAHWNQLAPFVEPIPPELLAKVQTTWPGPYTWVFPAKKGLPTVLTGELGGIAVRISDHPLVKALCLQYGHAIVSTSANSSGFPPARDYRTAQFMFADLVDYILPGEVGGLLKPTPIRDAMSGELLRP